MQFLFFQFKRKGKKKKSYEFFFFFFKDDGENRVDRYRWFLFLKWFSPIIRHDDYQTSSDNNTMLGFHFSLIYDIVSPRFFWGFIGTNETQDLLKHCPPGTFLIRFSATTPGFYTLSVTSNQIIEKDSEEKSPNTSKEKKKETLLDSLQSRLSERSLERQVEQEEVQKKAHQKEYEEELSQQEPTMMNKGEIVKLSHQIAEEREQYKQEKELAKWTLESKQLSSNRGEKKIRTLPISNPKGPEYLVCHFRIECKLIGKNAFQLKLQSQYFANFYQLIEKYRINPLPSPQKCRLDQPAEK